MPQLVLDLENIPDFEALPPADYPVVVEKVELRTNKEGTGQYLNWELIVTDGEFEGRHLFFMSSLSEKALWRLKATFKALGVYQEVMTIEVDEETGIVIEPELVGLPCIANLINEVYEGQKRDKVQTLLGVTAFDEPSAPAPAPVAPVPVPASRPMPPVRPPAPPVASRGSAPTAGAKPPTGRLPIK